MRRYGKTSDATVVPGKDAGIKLVLQPLADAAESAEIAPCEPSVTGLFWFSDSTGLFDQDSEAAYILAEGAAGPLLGVAKLVGEPCDLTVTWTHTWTPTTGTGGDPGYLEDGALLEVYPLADTVPGVLEVTADHDGKTYGPILLTVIKYACYYTPCPPPASNISGWLRLPDAYAYASYSGNPLQWYGTNDGSIGVAPSNVVTINFAAITATKIWIYCNDGGAGYYKVNGDGVTRNPQRGAFSPPWSGSGTPVSITNLSSLELHSDGYGSPWYVFIR